MRLNDILILISLSLICLVVGFYSGKAYEAKQWTNDLMIYFGREPVKKHGNKTKNK